MDNSTQVVSGLRMYGTMLLPSERPPYADEARHHSDNAQHELPEQGVGHLLRSDATRSNLHLVRRRRGHSHLQVQVRGNGCCGMRLQMRLIDGRLSVTLRLRAADEID